MADVLSDADILELRKFYIRDLYIAPTDGDPVGDALSHFNIASQRNFASDEWILNLASRIELDKSEILDNVANAKAARLVTAGKSKDVALAAGAALRRDCLFRLIRCEVWMGMIASPEFKASIADVKEAASMFATWRQQIERDNAFAMRRAGGLGAMTLSQA